MWHLVCHHVEDAPHGGHRRLVNEVTVSRTVEPKPVPDTPHCHYLPLTCSLQLAASRPLGRLRSLELGQLVENAIGKLALRAVVPPVVQRPQLAPLLLELPLQQVVIRGLASEAVPILSQDYRHA